MTVKLKCTLLQFASGWVGLSVIRLAVSCALPFNCHWPEVKKYAHTAGGPCGGEHTV